MKKKQQHQNTLCNLNQQLRLAFAALALVALSACATNKTSAPNDLSAAGTKRFDQADTNRDGKLSRDEASDYLVIEIFDSRDANRDGKMTVVEWTGGDPSRVVEFKKRDANQDGIVTQQEAIAYGRKRGVVIAIMKEADTNHDGYLQPSEVKAYYASREGPAN
jgi:hypothetical protein